MEFEREQIPLVRLRLNKENDRHGPLPSEIEAIEWLLTHHREHMINLAKDVAAHGLSPIESILVLPSGEKEATGDFVVWEGNRRIAALKILEDTNRCHDAELRRKFTDIKRDAKVVVPRKVECTIAPSAEEADRLIELRHQGLQDGVGTVPWDARQKDRHQQRLGKRGRYAISQQVLDAMADKLAGDLPDKVKAQDFPISTLDRILNNAYARDFLGLSTEGGTAQRVLEERETLKGLTKILRDISDGMPVRKVYSAELIRKYLDDFDTKHTPNPKKMSSKPVPLMPAGTTSTIAARPRSRALGRKRKYLLQNVSYGIGNKRINTIYRELRDLKVGEKRNAVAVLFRVFLELSVDQYLDEHKVAHNENEKLSSKAQKVVTHMKSKGWIDRHGAKGIDQATSSQHGPHSVDTFHAYVHNRKFHPEPESLNTAFDNLQPFFDALFNHLK